MTYQPRHQAQQSVEWDRRPGRVDRWRTRRFLHRLAVDGDAVGYLDAKLGTLDVPVSPALPMKTTGDAGHHHTVEDVTEERP